MTSPAPPSPIRGWRRLTRIRADRKLAVIGIVFALLYGLGARALRSAGFSDPIGPRAFPLLLAGLMIASALLLALRPTDHELEPPDRATWLHGGALVAGLVAYGYLLEPLGYLISTTGLVALLSSLFGGPRVASLVAAAALAACLYVIFSMLLGLYLPAAPSF